MIEVQIPKDVSVYESPLIGPLTARQAVCVGVGAGAEYIYYLVVSNFFKDMDINSIVGIGVLFAIPFMYLAVGKPYDMRPEVYFYYFLLPSMIGKKDRPYETELTFDTILMMQEGGEPEKPKKKKKSKPKRGKHDVMYA